MHQRGKLPGKVDRIIDPRVHPKTAGRREEVNGIAGENGAAVGETIGYEGLPRNPGRMANDLERNILTDAGQEGA